MGNIWEKQGKLYETYGKSPNYMEVRAGKIHINQLILQGAHRLASKDPGRQYSPGGRNS